MKPRFFYAAFLLFVGLVGCASHPQVPPQQSASSPSELPGFRPWYSTRKFHYIGEPSEAAAKHGYKYKDIVNRASHKDAAALHTLLTLDRDCEFDGAAAELHQSVLAEMMLLWGDYDFSHAISSMSPEVKKDLVFRFGHNEEALRLCFPLTADVLLGYRPPGEPKY